MESTRILMNVDEFNLYVKTYHFGLYCVKAVYNEPTWGSGSGDLYVVYFDHVTPMGLYQLGIDMAMWKELEKTSPLLRSDTQPNNPDRVIVWKPEPASMNPMDSLDPDEARDLYLENQERDFEDRMNAHFEGRYEN
jgi:hypothetical protein